MSGNEFVYLFVGFLFYMFLTITMTLAYPNLNSFMPFISNVIVAMILSALIWIVVVFSVVRGAE